MLLMNEPKSKPINRGGRWTKKLYYLLPLSLSLCVFKPYFISWLGLKLYYLLPLSLSLSVFKPYFISWLGCLGNETMMNRKRKIN